MRIIKIALKADAKKPEELDDVDIALQRIRDSAAAEYGPLSPDEETALEKLGDQINVHREPVKLGVLEAFYGRFLEWIRKSGLPKEFLAQKTREIANDHIDAVDIGFEMTKWEWSEEKKAIEGRQPWITGLASQAYGNDPDLNSPESRSMVRFLNNLDIRMGGLTPSEMQWLLRFPFIDYNFILDSEKIQVLSRMIAWARNNGVTLANQGLKDVYFATTADEEKRKTLEQVKRMDNTADFVADLSEGWKAWHAFWDNNEDVITEVASIMGARPPNGDHVYFLTDESGVPRVIIGTDSAPSSEPSLAYGDRTYKPKYMDVHEVLPADMNIPKTKEFFDIIRSKIGLIPLSASESSVDKIGDLEGEIKYSKQYGLMPSSVSYGGNPSTYVNNIIEILDASWDRDWSERQASGLVDDLFEYAYLRGEEGMIKKALEDEPWEFTRGKDVKGKPIKWSGHGFYEYADELWQENESSNLEYFHDPDPDDDEFHDPDLSEAENKKKYDEVHEEYESRRDYAEEEFAPNRLIKLLQAGLARMKKIRTIEKRRATIQRKKELAGAPAKPGQELERQMEEALKGVPDAPDEPGWEAEAAYGGMIVEAAARTFPDVETLMARLVSIGWEPHPTKQKGKGHTVMMAAPDGRHFVNISIHNYNSFSHTKDKVAGDILRVSRTLEFLFHEPYVKPLGFNETTMQIETPAVQYMEQPIAHISQLPPDEEAYQVSNGKGGWEEGAVDRANHQMLTKDGRLINLPEKNLLIRRIV